MANVISRLDVNTFGVESVTSIDSPATNLNYRWRCTGCKDGYGQELETPTTKSWTIPAYVLSVGHMTLIADVYDEDNTKAVGIASYEIDIVEAGSPFSATIDMFAVSVTSRFSSTPLFLETNKCYLFIVSLFYIFYLYFFHHH